MAAGGSSVPKSVTLNTFGTKTTDLTATYEFNYGEVIPAGSFVVICVTARSPSFSPGTWDSVVDSAGNTFIEAVEGTQSNNLTFTAIYYSKITNSVDTGTVITANATSSEFQTAQHHSVFVLTGVNEVDNIYSSPANSTNLVSASAITTNGSGIAVHAISTGLSSLASINSISEIFVEQSSLATGGCQQFTATSVFEEQSNTSIQNTFDMSVLANWASIMAIFK